MAAIVARVKSWVPRFGGLPREVSVLAAIAFCVALGFGIVIPAIPLFARTFGVSAFAASAVISVFAAMRLVSSPAAGWAVNRFGERTIMSSGLAIVGLSSLAAGFATDYVQLLVLRGLAVRVQRCSRSPPPPCCCVAPPEFRGRASRPVPGGIPHRRVMGPAVGARDRHLHPRALLRLRRHAAGGIPGSNHLVTQARACGSAAA